MSSCWCNDPNCPHDHEPYECDRQVTRNLFYIGGDPNFNMPMCEQCADFNYHKEPMLFYEEDNE